MDLLTTATYLLAARIKAGDDITKCEISKAVTWARDLHSMTQGVEVEVKKLKGEPTEFTFPVKGNLLYTLLDAQLATFKKNYKGLDVEAELGKAAAWCVANIGKRKTARGMPRFLNAWLSRAHGELPKTSTWMAAPAVPAVEAELEGLFEDE